jgi:hypothetical protein
VKPGMVATLLLTTLFAGGIAALMTAPDRKPVNLCSVMSGEVVNSINLLSDEEIQPRRLEE